MTVRSACACLRARRRAAPVLIAALLALFACTLVHADVRCVNSASGFVDAIDDANAGAEGSTWDIRVRPGTYQLNATVDFDPAGDHDNKLLYVSGGWNSDCSTQTGLAAGTVIRGIASTQDTVGTQFLFIGNNNRYDFRNIRFENFYDFLIIDPGCAPYNICPGTAAIVIDHVEFNNAERVSLVAYDSQIVTFRNNLVTNMTQIHGDGSGPDYAPVGIGVYSNAYVDISFNTLARLTCLSANGGLGIRSANAGTKLHHNIVQSNACSKDVYIETDYGGQKLTPWSNLLLSIANYNGNLVDQGNVLNVNPGFVDADNGNFRLDINASPAVNAGMSLLDAVQMGFYGPGLDLDGQLRPTGLYYDIGAYESTVNDGAPQVLTVTNTSDDADDTGSLRHAINTANAQVGVTQEIRFNIPGGCPKVILLDDELPDITDSLYINGYSQPGSVPNDLDVGSDATVCVLIAPAVGGVSHALQVPTGQPAATRLVVSGVGFGSSLAAFTATAIALRAGSGHRIEGNVFGGLLPNSVSTLGNLQRGVLIRGTAADVTVGGEENFARNYFADMLNNALVITDSTTSGHVIRNNYFGLTPNGLNAQANAADAISATGGTDVSIIDNVIDASAVGIYVSGASTTGFTIQGNKIGVNAIGIGIADDANDVGIEFGGGSGQHVVGYPANGSITVGTFSNDIRNNNTAGVLLSPSAGNYISVRGNRLEANGRSGNGLGIDIGTLGALPNDAGDIDGGPNTQQNHPVLKLSTANGATRQIKAQLATNANQIIRIDFYRSPSCPKGATGANATTYVGAVDVNSGVGGVLANIVAQVAPSGAPGYVTATATTNVGHTSELAPCFAEDTIFVDGVEAAGF